MHQTRNKESAGEDPQDNTVPAVVQLEEQAEAEGSWSWPEVSLKGCFCSRSANVNNAFTVFAVRRQRRCQKQKAVTLPELQLPGEYFSPRWVRVC